MTAAPTPEEGEGMSEDAFFKLLLWFMHVVMACIIVAVAWENLP
jgi:hypothetical protein